MSKSHKILLSSFVGLNAVNFFLAQIADVVVPFLNVFLREHNWRYDQIGMAMAIPGFASLMFQLPAGVICDRLKQPRVILAVMAVILGACYAVIPSFVETPPLIFAVLFVTGIAGSFFMPLLGTLALSLVGHEKLDTVLGGNRSWSHAGNFAGGFITLMVIRWYGFTPLFYVAGLLSAIAAVWCFVIRKKDLKPLKPLNERVGRRRFKMSFVDMGLHLLKMPQVRFFLICITLFHFANGPLGSLVSLYLKDVGSTDEQIAWMVMISQPVMIPVAYLSAIYAARFGRKPVMGLALVLLPIRIVLYTLTRDPIAIVFITALDGVISGIFGVLVTLMCSDLTKGKEGFNSLIGLAATAPALGAMAGSFSQGLITEHFGFAPSFLFFAAFGLLAILMFAFCVDETGEPQSKKVAKQWWFLVPKVQTSKI